MRRSRWPQLSRRQDLAFVRQIGRQLISPPRDDIRGLHFFAGDRLFRAAKRHGFNAAQTGQVAVEI